MGIEEIIKELKRMSSVKAAILFGSHAKGKQRKESDIDICVVAEDDEALMMSSEKFDISLFHRLPLIVRYRVFKDGKILFCKDERLLTKLRFWTLKLYLDEKHWRDRAVERVLS